MSLVLKSFKNRAFAANVSSSVATPSVRFYNIGAIAKDSKGRYTNYGAIASSDLPGSNGRPLATPVFSTVYGGAAYWGDYIARRVYFNDFSRDDGTWNVTLREIFKKYSTGHSDSYMNTVSKDTGIGVDEPINFMANNDPQGMTKLFNVMVAMGRWEGDARGGNKAHTEAFNKAYMTESAKNELWYGMRHGLYESIRSAGYTIEKDGYEIPFDENAAPIYDKELDILSREVWKETFPEDDYDTGLPIEEAVESPQTGGSSKGDELVKSIIEGDQAIMGRLAGWRSMITGGMALFTNWMNTSLVSTGLIDQNTSNIITGGVWVLIFAFGFFMAMKLLRYFFKYLETRG